MIYHIPKNNEMLLQECDVETFCASGHGGQNVNRRETAVRLKHRPSGTVVVCQQERTQYRNKKLALENLRRKIERMNRPRRRRIPTKIPKGVREKILDHKKRHSLKKKRRKRILDF
jgi:ribosome-associated protein